MKLISIGEVVWDLFGERRHPGGAPLNFAHHFIRGSINSTAVRL